MRKSIVSRAIYRVMISNGHARTLEKRSRIYRKLEKKYRHVLEEGVKIEIDDKLDADMESDYVWICWFQGMEEAPPLVKACVASVKKNMPHRKIVILTEETIPKYVDFPEHIVKKREKGMIPNAHYSDLLRTELLCRYGGMWIDATVLCTSKQIPEYISKAPLFVYKQLDLSRHDDTAILASSWFISAKCNQPVLLMTRKLLFEYWKDHNDLIEYFLFHLFFGMAARKYKKEWEKIPVFNNHSPHVLQFELEKDYSKERWEQILSMSVFHKLNRYHNFEENTNSFYANIINMYGNEE